LKDNEENPEPDTIYGLKKEEIYKRIPGSKLTKVTYVRELQDKKYITVKSMKKLTEAGLIDGSNIERGEWNSQFVTLSDTGRDLLEKLEIIRGTDNSPKMELSSSPSVKEISKRSDYDEKSNRSFSRNIDRHSYGSELVTYLIDKIIKKLEEPESCNTMDAMNKTIDYIEKEVNRLVGYLDDKDKELFGTLSLSKYRTYDIEPYEIATLLEKKFYDVKFDTLKKTVDGKALLDNMTASISNKLKQEVPGLYEELEEDLNDLQKYHDLLFK